MYYCDNGGGRREGGGGKGEEGRGRREGGAAYPKNNRRNRPFPLRTPDVTSLINVYLTQFVKYVD